MELQEMELVAFDRRILVWKSDAQFFKLHFKAS